MTFQIFSTYAALPFKYCKELVTWVYIYHGNWTHLKIISMLPHIHPKNWGFPLPNQRVLVLRRNNRQSLLFPCLNLNQPSPPTSLNAQKRSLERFTELLFVTPRSIDLLH